MQMDTSARYSGEPGVIISTVIKLCCPAESGMPPATGANAPMHETTKGPAVAGAVMMPVAPGACVPHRSAPGPWSP
jgi:hypothetical protein